MIDQWTALVHGLDRTLAQLAVWLVIAMLVMMPLERLRSLRPQAVLRPNFVHDLLYYFLSGVLPAFALVVFYALVMRVFQGLLPQAWFDGVQGLPGWLRIVATVVVADFGFYWAHRWAHEIPALWRFHAIHHSPTQIDWLVATRTHPLEIAWLRGLSFIPVFALGLVDPAATSHSTAMMVVVLFSVLWGFFIHGNVRFRLKWLEQFLSTPRFHHWHHANDGVATNGKNYAALVPVLDRLFGTLHLPAEGYPQQYGSTTPVPTGFLAQLALLPGAQPTHAASSSEEPKKVVATHIEDSESSRANAPAG